MRRILTVALLAIGGMLAMAGVATADIGDVRELRVDNDSVGTASEVELSGQIRCQATIEYGLWAGVAQDNPGGNPANNTFIQSGDEVEDDPASAEGVGAYGPNFDPPVGVSDDSPCSQSLQGWDVVVQQNRDSGDFFDGNIHVFVAAGTSAENGGRGPGPFIGDILGTETQTQFDRTR